MNTMPTNNFGDNWLTDEERRFWGTDEYGNPVPCVPTKVEREVRSVEFCNKIKLRLWFWWAFFGLPWLVVLWAIFTR